MRLIPVTIGLPESVLAEATKRAEALHRPRAALLRDILEERLSAPDEIYLNPIDLSRSEVNRLIAEAIAVHEAGCSRCNLSRYAGGVKGRYRRKSTGFKLR